jgi:hypothetical protein
LLRQIRQIPPPLQQAKISILDDNTFKMRPNVF